MVVSGHIRKDISLGGKLIKDESIGGHLSGFRNAGGGAKWELGHTMKLVDNVLDVNTTDEVQQDNTLPITSAAVYTEVGNINALLATI